jgi:hypothetical protein
MRRTISATILLALILAPVEIAAAHERNALRSGTIQGGTGLEMAGGQPWEHPAAERSGCEHAVDCLSWLRSGCNPALVGHDPALTASIVDVGDLADGRTRRHVHMTAPTIPPWGLWPGAVIQFWRPDCTEIQHAKRHTIGSSAKCEWQGEAARCKAFRIPTGARWMTVSGYATTARLSWSLI